MFGSSRRPSGNHPRRKERFYTSNQGRIEATWFISPDWPGPLVLGWKGCLERLRFALDPTPEEEWFYFGPIEDNPFPF
jgi:hypothetical protein